MKRFIGVFAIAAGLVSSAQAVSVRYFLSLNGLSDPNNTDGPAIAPPLGNDPTVDVGNNPNAVTRLYLWADISESSGPTDLKGFTLRFRTDGNVQILNTNIWQNNLTLPGFTRWNPAGFPGLQNWNSQLASPGSTVAVLEPGITNGAFAAFDDQHIGGRSVVGWIEVQGNQGDVNVVNVGTGFLQGSSSTNSVMIGWADPFPGFPAEVIGQVHDTLSPEATIIPEPASALLLAAATGLVIRRRR